MQKLFGTVALVATLLLIPFTLHAGGRLVRLEGVDRAQLQEIHESGVYDVLEYRDGTVVAVEDPQLIGALPFTFGTGTTELMADVDDVFAPFREQGSEGAYHSVEEVQSELQELAEAYPDRLELVEIGRSWEDRPLTAARVAPRDGQERPRGVFMGMIHAREWVTTELAMAFLHELLETEDPVLRELLGQVEVWVIPCLNPDGLHWSQTQYAYWRGNRRVNENGTFGVDLNRNFTVGWGVGSSSWPGSQTYMGPEPLSEPESRAYAELVDRLRPALTMTWHSYGRMVLHPWGYQWGEPPRDDLFDQYAAVMKEQTGYRTGSVTELIGRVGGATDDHVMEEYGAFPMTLEIGTTFIPDESEIDGIVENAMPAAMTWLKAIPVLDGIDPMQPPAPAEAAFARLHVGR